MPEYSTHVDPTTGIGTISILGPLDFAQLAVAVSRLWQDERYSWRVLFDGREADLSKVEGSAIQQAAEGFRKAWPDSPPGRAAFLVSRNVDYGVSRMTEALTGRLPTEGRTFRDFDEAWAWLSHGLAD